MFRIDHVVYWMPAFAGMTTECAAPQVISHGLAVRYHRLFRRPPSMLSDTPVM